MRSNPPIMRTRAARANIAFEGNTFPGARAHCMANLQRGAWLFNEREKKRDAPQYANVNQGNQSLQLQRSTAVTEKQTRSDPEPASAGREFFEPERAQKTQYRTALHK